MPCSEAQLKASKKWREANREKNREACRKWRATNPEAQRAATRRWEARNKEYIRLRRKEYCAENPERVKRWNENRSKKVYAFQLARRNFSVPLYESLKEKQAGKCAICDAVPVRLCADHDHVSGKPRGLLCRKCNSGLGFFVDSIPNLKRAVDYLRRASVCIE